MEANCHPGRVPVALGLCKSCYQAIEAQVEYGFANEAVRDWWFSHHGKSLAAESVAKRRKISWLTSLSPQRRREVAQKAANTRWARARTITQRNQPIVKKKPR